MSNAASIARFCSAVRDENSGLNDNFNGVERPVSFDIPGQSAPMRQVVHSLAKWKRLALQALRLQRRQGPVRRHERHPPRRGGRQPPLRLCGPVGLGEGHLREDRNVAYLKTPCAPSSPPSAAPMNAEVAFPLPAHQALPRLLHHDAGARGPLPRPAPRSSARTPSCKEHVVFMMQIGGKLKAASPTTAAPPTMTTGS